MRLVRILADVPGAPRERFERLARKSLLSGTQCAFWRDARNSARVESATKCANGRPRLRGRVRGLAGKIRICRNNQGVQIPPVRPGTHDLIHQAAAEALTQEERTLVEW